MPWTDEDGVVWSHPDVEPTEEDIEAEREIEIELACRARTRTKQKILNSPTRGSAYADHDPCSYCGNQRGKVILGPWAWLVRKQRSAHNIVRFKNPTITPCALWPRSRGGL